MADQRAFHLGRADTVAGDVHDVVNAAHQPVIAIRIGPAAVTREIDVRIHREVGVDESVVVAPGGPHHAGPRFLDAEFAAFVGAALRAVVAQDDWFDAEERLVGAAGLERVRAGKRVDEDAARLGLPPRIDNGTTALADDAVIPHPRFGINGFTHGTEHAQRAQVVFVRPFFAQPDQGADGGRGRVEDRHFEFLHDLPEPAGIREGGHALEHQAGGAVAERAINDVGVAGDPADVRRAPVDVIFMHVEDVFMGQSAVQQVAGGSVDDPLGFAGGTGGVEHEQKVFSVVDRRRAVGARGGHRS